jgi:uroporphyrinogen-III synthase
VTGGGVELLGLRVAVTRPRDQAAELVAGLRARGAEAPSYPVIRLSPPEDPSDLRTAAAGLHAFDWVVFTSANGARYLARALEEAGVDPRAASAVACVGPATEAAARAAGFEVTLTADRFVAEGLVDALAAAGPLVGGRILLPRSSAGRDALPVALRRLGAQVSDVPAYRPEVDREALAELRRDIEAGGIDVVAFTSSSAVSAYAEVIGAAGPPAACIGPVTADTARERGLEVAIVAREHTTAGLIAALEAWRAATVNER